MDNLQLKDILLVILGGLFGFTLGKLPIQWVWLVLAAAILLMILVAGGYGV